MNSLSRILDKAAKQQRIDRDEALELASGADMHTLGETARSVRHRRYGNKAFFVYNQHLNFTNVCINACRFCAYSKKKGQKGAYALNLEQVEKAIQDRIQEPIDEIHIVGGLNPELDYSYYLNLLGLVRKLRPKAAVKAFTAVEIAFLADEYGYTHEKILMDFAGAGLDALPGGGAEVFSA
ncbi:MAG: radical SAM protein [Desulfonatronovibrionaceae bacterium]